MSDTEQARGTTVELILLEPEIVAWLDDYRPERADDDDTNDEPPTAA
jgi:hypothetical protein